MTSVQQADTPAILAAKKRFGRLDLLDFRMYDAVTAHRLLGESVGPQVHRRLAGRLDEMDTDQACAMIRVARHARDAITARLRSPGLDPGIRRALADYLACLGAWAQGARLDQFQHERIAGLGVDGQQVSGDNLALLLQDDNRGCQTGAVRTRSGSVVLWHTEEDAEKEPGSRFDAARIMTFRAGEGATAPTVSAFVYPDLLPGSAFGWRSDGFVQAVDALFLRSDVRDGHMLANVVTWVTLRLGPAFALEPVVRAIGPYLDGYVINTIRAEEAGVRAEKVEFAGNEAAVSLLGSEPGSFFFQVNVFSDPHGPLAQRYEHMPAERRGRYDGRIARTERMMAAVMPEKGVEAVFDMLASREGEGYAYCNEDVKGYLVCEISSEVGDVWVGGGPRIAGDRLYAVKLGHR